MGALRWLRRPEALVPFSNQVISDCPGYLALFPDPEPDSLDRLLVRFSRGKRGGRLLACQWLPRPPSQRFSRILSGGDLSKPGFSGIGSRGA